MRFHYFKALQQSQALSRHQHANANTKAAMVIIVMETVPWSSQSSRWSIQRGCMVAGMGGPLQRRDRWQVPHSTTCNTMPARCSLPRGAQDDFTMQRVFIYVCVCVCVCVCVHTELHSVWNDLLEWLTGVNIGLASTKVRVSLNLCVSRRQSPFRSIEVSRRWSVPYQGQPSLLDRLLTAISFCIWIAADAVTRGPTHVILGFVWINHL